MDILELMGSFIIGTIAGIISSLFGIGGATIIIPLLRIFLGFSGYSAIATAIPITTFAALFGSFWYYGKKLIEINVAITCGVTGAIFAIIGANATYLLDEKTLIILLSIFLFILSILCYLNKTKENKNISKNGKIITFLLIGAIAGFSSGFFGIGGGVIIVPLLLYAGFGFKKAVGTSLAIMLIYTIPASITHYSFGHMDITYTIVILIGTIIGSIIGSRIVFLADENKMKIVLSIILFVLAVSLIFNEV